MNDDGTGLRQLTTTDLLTYAIGQKQLTQLELELVHRLEQITNQRLELLEKLPTLPCMQCPAFPELMPEDVEDALIELDGDTQWA